MVSKKRAGDGIPVVDVLDRAAGLGHEAFDRGVVGVDRAVRRQAADDGGGDHARQRVDAIGERLVEAADRGGVAIDGRWAARGAG